MRLSVLIRSWSWRIYPPKKKEKKNKRREKLGTSTHLLSQNELGILIVGILASFELSDLDILLLEFLVVALFLLDETVEHRGGDCELRWSGHRDLDLFFSFGGMVFGYLI